MSFKVKNPGKQQAPSAAAASGGPSSVDGTRASSISRRSDLELGSLIDGDGGNDHEYSTPLIFSSVTRQATTYGQASAVILQERRAQNFRSRLTVLLAAVAILNFFQVITFFFVAPPPGMLNNHSAYDNNTSDSSSSSSSSLTPKGKAATSGSSADGYNLANLNLWRELDPATHRVIFLAEGGVQLFFTCIGVLIIFLSHISRHAEKWSCFFSCVPRSPGSGNMDGGTGWTGGEIAELIIWILHCPNGAALISQRFRYLNGFCIFRLYTVIQAAMSFTDFNTLRLQVVARFFGLQLTSGVFLRWVLASKKKWWVLILSFLFLWMFMAMCMSFAEGWHYNGSLWFVMVTFSTTGYGDLAPKTLAGRIAAVLTMMIGLVVLAYIVAQVQQLTGLGVVNANAL